ncbi:metal ABC transporter permease [Helcococcus ovis]|uniref:Metal ABC transporter permease n=1 Tax=Helcococcus ovis TaxID=72026 RepID=A0A4R9C195_9FIRM|nr:iron chelate uptake ABC transporter family permease subunit [Helcococcus ovis]TFF66152.1 metal ABC transporter permease [Helcococcus ovis]TFF66401.1 metal ABC transporter permease [Helcococcus ovis]TFF68714.1 metal ABC transporter permease [Helcococcus ovis]WNZ01655.1 iron chelate uptake ABC transporter family permease subunit [Helcococcus ovis]
MEILKTYSFQIVAIGTIILAIVSSFVGSINVYKGQSLIGDAMGHSTFSGIVLSFILFSSRNPVILLGGAMLSSAISYYLIQFGRKHSKIGLDANMAIFLSGFFGLGMVLKSYIQGNKAFSGVSQAGLENYIFGQAAYLLEEDVKLILIASMICIFIILFFLKEFKVYLFDKEYAKLIRINTGLLDYLILFMTILVIGVGIKAVGAVLISSFLIIPTVSASQWTNRFSILLLISSVFGAISAFVGSYVSTVFAGFSTGPSIILISGILFVISFIFGRNGIRRKVG